MHLALVVLLGAIAVALPGCGDSKSLNDSIMSVVARYDSERRPPAEGWKTTCNYVPAVKTARYCFHQITPHPKYTIWFFHGAGDSEQVFLSSPFKQQSYFELEEGLQADQAANIVTISFGPLWLVTNTKDRQLEPRDATVDTIVTIMRSIEKAGFPIARPYVAMGHSQGGLNVATLCAAKPDEWSKCVLLNPMLPDCNPFNEWPVCPTILSPLAAVAPNLLIKANYLPRDWKDGQPSVLLQGTSSLPPSFVTACRTDLFGLYAGPMAWSKSASQLAPSTWVDGSPTCDHFQWPAKQVLKFLNPDVTSSAPIR
jgi:predicted esterase